MLFEKYLYQKQLPIVSNHHLRCVFDFSYLEIICWLKNQPKKLATNKRQILDIGSGISQYQKYFRHADYHKSDISYDDLSVPKTPEKFDIILLIEVLEHVKNTDEFLGQVKSQLLAHGEIWISVPFNARHHPCPHDFYRWSEEGLRHLMKQNDLDIVALKKRGNSICSAYQKLLWFVYSWRHYWFLFPFRLMILIVPLPLVFIIAHILRWCRYEDQDPLGFFLKVRADEK